MKSHDGQCLNLVSYLALATRVHMNSPGRDASPSQVPSQQCWYSSTAEYTETNEINSLVLVSLTRLNSQRETLHKIHLSSIISLFISYHHNVIAHQLRRFALAFIHSHSGATGVFWLICRGVYFRFGAKKKWQMRVASSNFAGWKCRN